MKLIREDTGSRSRSKEQKKRNFLLRQCKTSISSKCGSVQSRAVKFPCSMRFSTMVN